MQVSHPFALFLNWLLFNLFLRFIGSSFCLSCHFAFRSCLISFDLSTFLGTFLLAAAFYFLAFDDRVAILIDQSLILHPLKLGISFRFGSSFSL